MSPDSPRPNSPAIESLPVEQVAAAIVNLINSRPQTPRQDEIANIIMHAMVAERVGGHPPGKPITCASDIEFEPIVGSDGRPLQFAYTREEFAADCPWLWMMFATIGKDRDELRDAVRQLAQDPDDPDADLLFKTFDVWQQIEDEFGAIAQFARVAWARTAAVAEALGDEDPEVCRVLNRGVAKRNGEKGDDA